MYEGDPRPAHTHVGADGETVTLSRAQLLAAVRDSAGRLVATGLRPGDRVALVAADPGPFVRAFLGAVWAGLVPVPVPPPPPLARQDAWSDALAEALRAADPAALVAPGATLPLLSGIRARPLSRTESNSPASSYPRPNPDPVPDSSLDRYSGRCPAFPNAYSYEFLDAAGAVTNFSGYDYLGLAHDPVVTTAAKEAIDRYGTSVSASRAASGERPVHGLLEEALARHLDAERALVLIGGHSTNVSVLGHLLGPGDLIVHDAFAHNSIVQGAQLSGARRRVFPHNDLAALDRILAEHRPSHGRVVVAVEGVYSMDGDLADLPALIELRHRHDVMLYLDEAHSVGVLGATGAGAVEHWGVPPDAVDIRMGTLSKALASCGGYVAGSEALVTHPRHTTPGFIYSVGIPPSTAAAALAALERLRRDPALAAKARARAARFRELAVKAGLNTGLSEDGSCVVPVITGDAATALRLADGMRRRGVNAQPFIPPAVENHQSRLRFFVTAQHSERDIAETVRALTAELALIQRAFSP